MKIIERNSYCHIGEVAAKISQDDKLSGDLSCH